MKKILFLSSLFLLLFSACIENDSIENELQELDTILDHREEWVDQRYKTIEQLKTRYKQIANPEEKYWIAKAIFEEYLDFDSDSAYLYTQRNYNLATQIQSENEQKYWKIQEAYILTETGQLEEAHQLLEQVRPSLADSVLLSNYYGVLLHYHYISASYRRQDYYISDNYHFKQEIKARDSLMMYLTPASPQFLQFKVWQFYFEKTISKNYRDELEEAVLRSPLETQNDVINAFMLSQAFREDGDMNKSLKYLIWSAKALVKSGSINHTSDSFQEICLRLLERGDVTRAYTYINYCSSNLSQYDNRVQSLRISHLQNIIKDRYLSHERQLQRLTLIMTMIIGFMFIILLIALYFLYKQVLKVRQKRVQLGKAYRDLNQQLINNRSIRANLEAANIRLEELNDKLSTANDLLTESNFVKEEYIGYVFSICSSYIDKLDKYRKTISRKIKAGQVAELAKYTPSNIEVQNDMKEFYQSFDAIFLRIYPNFVNDINDLMKENERITLSDENHLNTDLRILALMRLGISDCEKIADFLHCSVQSVYNSRRSVYSRLRIPMKDFKAMVPNLGNASRLA